MFRNRVITKSIADKLNQDEDKYLEKLVKYIPIEVVATYLFFRSTLLVEKGEIGYPYGLENEHWLYGIILAIGFIGTIIYKWVSLKEPTLKKPWYQVIVSAIAFLIWVYSFGDYFEINWESYNRKLGAIMLGTFTLFAPLLEKVFDK